MHKNSFETLSLQGGMNMRIAIISDIHGNAVALEAVLNDLKQNPLITLCVWVIPSLTVPSHVRLLLS